MWRVCREHGVAMQLEVHGEGSSRLPRIRKILDYGGNHPAVRVCWNSNPTDLLDGGFDANFVLVRDQIGQVHMRDLFVDYPGGGCSRRCQRCRLRATASRRFPSRPIPCGC